ncbi:TadE family type IV pilus minor pilin [Kineosporia babensis]|uniref:Pilus assembly protein n=1 Tax=Kineosporia babensis TaxID=499548 RepID=A0A9X1NEL0_9ACTN|nr:pilus assembly protein [Kineosporia babensis]
MTAEFALALPFFVLLLATLMAAVVAGTAQVQCIDAARAGARAAARHDDPRPVAAAAGPQGAEIRVSTGGDLVKVQVSTELDLPLPWHPRIRVQSESTAQAEPDTTAIEGE